MRLAGHNRIALMTTNAAIWITVTSTTRVIKLLLTSLPPRLLQPASVADSSTCTARSAPQLSNHGLFLFFVPHAFLRRRDAARARELAFLETGFYLAGMKSHCRMPAAAVTAWRQWNCRGLIAVRSGS